MIEFFKEATLLKTTIRQKINLLAVVSLFSGGIAPSAAGVETACSTSAIPAEVLRVIDGDTLEVRAEIWPNQWVRTKVRLAGIDAPERGQAGFKAAGRAVERLFASTVVTLCDPQPGKYAGRIIARVKLADGRDLSCLLLDSGFVRPYP